MQTPRGGLLKNSETITLIESKFEVLEDPIDSKNSNTDSLIESKCEVKKEPVDSETI